MAEEKVSADKKSDTKSSKKEKSTPKENKAQDVKSSQSTKSSAQKEKSTTQNAKSTQKEKSTAQNAKSTKKEKSAPKENTAQDVKSTKSTKSSAQKEKSTTQNAKTIQKEKDTPKENSEQDVKSSQSTKSSAQKEKDTSQSAKSAQKENIHSGHRQRMLSKLNADNLDVLESHEILEMLLYSVNKQKNTNPLAHELLNRFGSLSQIMKASEKELLSVNGIGNASVQLIRTVRALVDRVLKENVKVGQTLRDPEKIKKFCAGLFKTVDREEIRIIFLNNEFKYLSQDLLGVGATNAVFLDTFTLIRKIAERRCTIVILTHNHPRGSEIPSSEDKYLTRNLFNVLDKSGVYLADHVIVGMNGVFSMAQSNIFPGLWRNTYK